jgi:hypothetical protein
MAIEQAVWGIMGCTERLKLLFLVRRVSFGPTTVSTGTDFVKGSLLGGGLG